MAKTHREQLEESVTHYQLSADFERHQARLNLALFGSGTALFALGVIGTFGGVPEVGIPAIAMGVGMEEVGRRDAKAGIDRAMEMQGKADVRQYQLDHQQ
ncbi:MAG TPA: hypothetical protein VFH99_01845 [Candidatus Saccharimonadales bacterium]|nr:hypothetical protein [Candidatus Saccharimonadales bacterium]